MMAMNSVSLHRYIKHVICNSNVYHVYEGKITCSIDNAFYLQITFKYLLKIMTRIRSSMHRWNHGSI